MCLIYSLGLCGIYEGKCLIMFTKKKDNPQKLLCIAEIKGISMDWNTTYRDKTKRGDISLVIWNKLRRKQCYIDGA